MIHEITKIVDGYQSDQEEEWKLKMYFLSFKLNFLVNSYPHKALDDALLLLKNLTSLTHFWLLYLPPHEYLSYVPHKTLPIKFKRPTNWVKCVSVHLPELCWSNIHRKKSRQDHQIRHAARRLKEINKRRSTHDGPLTDPLIDPASA